MTSRLAGPPPADHPLPPALLRLDAQAEPVWLNLLGGVTVRLRSGDYAKWMPAGVGDLRGEAERLRWARGWHPVAEVLDHGQDDEGSWLVTRGIPARSAVDPTLDTATAVRAIGAGLRALHDALPVQECPYDWSVEARGGSGAPPVDRLVVCHGDACAPNTLVGDDGEWAAHVDLGTLGVADRWADVAVAAMSLGWNFGPGWEPEFLASYGVERDDERMAYYAALWNGPTVE